MQLVMCAVGLLHACSCHMYAPDTWHVSRRCRLQLLTSPTRQPRYWTSTSVPWHYAQAACGSKTTTATSVAPGMAALETASSAGESHLAVPVHKPGSLGRHSWPHKFPPQAETWILQLLELSGGHDSGLRLQRPAPHGCLSAARAVPARLGCTPWDSQARLACAGAVGACQGAAAGAAGSVRPWGAWARAGAVPLPGSPRGGCAPKGLWGGVGASAACSAACRRAASQTGAALLCRAPIGRLAADGHKPRGLETGQGCRAVAAQGMHEAQAGCGV